MLTETVSGESPFNIVVNEKGITLLVDAEVIDQQGRLVPSGQQPLAWTDLTVE
ncbi:hypothetical protein AB0E82_26675 [Streptomyces anulatus]|uniref:hypothetical protein n=1 Tax=Streptomyces anulatus TaxID=1892 RepID=UPI0033DAAE2B